MADGNLTYSSENGMLLDAAGTSLLLVPEGVEGEAVLPGSMATVPACVFSRCTKLTAISVVSNPGSAAHSAFTTRDGILYTSDMKTLVAAPPALGASAAVAPECERIAEGAFWGNADLATIVSSGKVRQIATGAEKDGLLVEAPAFNDDALANATVALIVPADEFDAACVPWKAAGFTQFAEPAQVGDVQQPESGSGFAYTLLPDYTLAVAWTGDDEPEAELRIPASAVLNEVEYKVTAVADQGFAQRDSIVTVEVPASISAIGAAAFEDCANLKTAQLDDAVQTIGARAFANTGLTTFILPAKLQAMGDEALAGLKGTVIVDTNQFDGVPATALSGTIGANIYTPYREDSAYAWQLGIPAAGNQLLPYGLKLGRANFDLEVGESASLFGGSGYAYTPGDVSVMCTYSAKAMSIDPQAGRIYALKEGGTHFVLTLTLPLSIDGVQEAHQIELDITPQN